MVIIKGNRIICSVGIARKYEVWLNEHGKNLSEAINKLIAKDVQTTAENSSTYWINKLNHIQEERNALNEEEGIVIKKLKILEEIEQKNKAKQKEIDAAVKKREAEARKEEEQEIKQILTIENIEKVFDQIDGENNDQIWKTIATNEDLIEAHANPSSLLKARDKFRGSKT